ncbi:MAG: PD-(D/E)XK nuclease family protein [Alphaproteobacteria bacterium]
MSNLHVYSAPWHEDLLVNAAARMLAKYPNQLPEITAILPHRRGVLALRDALSKAVGEATLLLPRMLPVRDLELLFVSPPDIPEAMSLWQQRLLMARLVYRFERANSRTPPSFAQVMALSDALMELHAALVRDSPRGLTKDAMERIKGQGAEHWRRRADFLDILFQVWPLIAAENHRITATEREIRMILALAAAWENSPPAHPVYLIGSTGSIPAMRELMRVVAALPEGHVVLPGLDGQVSEDVPPGHPQYHLAQSLAHMGIKAHEVTPLSTATSTPRQRLWQQVMAAEHLAPLPEDAAKGITLIAAEEEEEEAALIALITREGLISDEKTIAIVTPDVGRMERIRQHLALWQIFVTTPQGASLSTLPFGSLRVKILACLSDDVSVVSLLDLLHNNAVMLGENPAAWQALLQCLRDSCRGVLSGLSLAQRVARLTPEHPLQMQLATIIAALEKLSAETLPLAKWLDELEILCRALVPQPLAGQERGQELIEELRANDAGELIAPADFAEILRAALRDPVRIPLASAHPRVHILSPIEARLQHFDRVILAGFNEGEWTAPPAPDPWLNMAQKAKLGLPPPGSDTSLLALDVVTLGMATELFIIRAERSAGRPTTPARFLTRLKTCLETLPPAEDASKWLHWRQELRRSSYQPIPPAMPTPPPALRPCVLSVSNIEYLFTDPYRIYATHGLGIRETKPFDQLPDAATFGHLIHRLIKIMIEGALDPDAPGWLEYELRHLEGDARMELLWLPRIRRILRFVAAEHQARGAGQVKNEDPITHTLNDHPVTLKGRIDRLEENGQGSYSIHDYKTGEIPSAKNMTLGFAPQLIAYALMLEEERGIWPNEILYWELPRARHEGKLTEYALGEMTLAEHTKALRHALRVMTETPLPYLALKDDSPYAVLSRNDEWA